MTMTGQFLVSLLWSSPEQAKDQPSKIDIRTDVYALGVILNQFDRLRLWSFETTDAGVAAWYVKNGL
jgi:hypothetical protein